MRKTYRVPALSHAGTLATAAALATLFTQRRLRQRGGRGGWFKCEPQGLACANFGA